ncbi:MAG: L,D-transpeptidase family protein [Peptoniphilaceae bacterium]|nr:L,D-transpeptidase family protein [Peptoniphilaceae bacterium]MDY6086057.1 L,D-transpeptidase family protein [Peptoniphilaceae bacterium]
MNHKTMKRLASLTLAVAMLPLNGVAWAAEGERQSFNEESVGQALVESVTGVEATATEETTDAASQASERTFDALNEGAEEKASSEVLEAHPETTAPVEATASQRGTEAEPEGTLPHLSEGLTPAHEPATSAVKGATRDLPIRYSSKTDQFTRGDEVLKSQWIDYLGGRYFTKPDGTVYRNTFLTFGKRGAYYVGPSGLMLTGKQEIDGDLYYFAEDGAERGRLVQSNKWTETPEGWVFPRPDGRLYRNQFITFGAANRYYMDGAGVKVTGIAPANGTVMHFDEDGRLVQRAHKYEFNGKVYFSNEKGDPYRNTFVRFGEDTYYMGADGAAMTGVFAVDGTAYRMDAEGRLVRKSSAYEYDGKTYFARPDGWPYRSRVLTFGPKKAIYMGADGAQQYGLIDGGKKDYYADPKTGNLVKNAGLFTVGDETYYSGASYELTKGWKKIGGKSYFFDTTTKLPWRVEGEDRVIDGKSYHFNNSGVATRNTAVKSVRGEWTYDGYTLSGPAVRDRDAGRNLVVISLEHQYMWIFKNGKLAYETAVITGKPGTRTIRGNFYVQGKQRDRYLTGPDWKSWVNYWVQFSGNYGIHDASWQRGRNFYYDSEAYTWTGSHGCVNVYPGDMPTVYRLVNVGTPVTVY